MNYRHIYHAGNFADAFKHIVLMLALEHLRAKDKPFFALDTHAGIGRYDLWAPEAQTTGEADQGIGRVWRAAGEDPQTPPEIVRYLELVRKTDARNKKTPRFYPGSPLIIQAMMRPQDRFIVNELHPEDVEILRQEMGRDSRIRIESENGYQLLKSELPPQERRGLVLTDPPFEVRDEFAQMMRGLQQAYKRWATGIYILWYPIKDPALIRNFYQELKDTGIGKITAFDFLLRKPVDKERLNGCGMAVINPPWTLADQVGRIGPWLTQVISEGQGKIDIRQIAGEE